MGSNLMDEGATRGLAYRRATTRLVIVLAACAAGCTTYVGTTARSFLMHVKSNPDPNIRYVAYSKLGSKDLYDNPEQKSEAVATLIDKYQNGKEPVAIRAVICRTLGELGDPSARGVLLQAVHHQEAVIKIEACRALGKVGRPPGAVQVVQRDRAGLDVGADAHRLGGTDQHSDAPVATRGEQVGLGLVGLGGLHVADGTVVDPASHEERAQFVVCVPAVAGGGGDVAEHQLQRAGSKGCGT